MNQKAFKRLKVGDKVRIKTIEELDNEFEYDKEYECYCSIKSFIQEMKEFAGKIVTIAGIKNDTITIAEDFKTWHYSYDVLTEEQFVTYGTYCDQYNRTVVFQDCINVNTGELLSIGVVGWYYGKPDDKLTQEISNGDNLTYITTRRTE